MGLPYILGDKDPKDPENGWDKTWAYLKELGKNIEYYPTGTGATMKELGEGSRDMIASHDRLGHQPARPRHRAEGGARSARSRASTGSPTRTTWAMPKGVSDEKLAVLLDLMTYLLTQAGSRRYTYDKGYFYPGPAVKDVPLSMAPKESQDAIKRVRPSRIRQADRRGAVRGAAAGGQAGRTRSSAGTSRSARGVGK